MIQWILICNCQLFETRKFRLWPSRYFGGGRSLELVDWGRWWVSFCCFLLYYVVLGCIHYVQCGIDV